MAPVATTAAEATTKVNEIVDTQLVAVFSKSYCPFCVKLKNLFKDLGVDFHAVELDEIGDEGSLIQAALKTKTKQSTVPNVFINGKHIGGCDDTFRLHNSGKLLPLVQK